MTTTHKTGPDEALDAAALRRFARERGFSEAYAIGIYEREVRQLNANARVRSFISIIAEKRTKDALRERASNEDAYA